MTVHHSCTLENAKSIIALSKCNTLRVGDNLNAKKFGDEPKVLHLKLMHKLSDDISGNILVISGNENIIDIHEKLYLVISRVIHM